MLLRRFIGRGTSSKSDRLHDNLNETMSRPALNRTPLSDQIYEILKERILDQHVLPGARLNIDALARDLGASSSPLREALSRLEAERLVVSAPFSGFAVAPAPSPAYLRDLLDFRIMLEARCAEIGAPKQDTAILAELRLMAQQMAATRKLETHYKQYRRFVAADIRFHQAIVRSGGNEVMIDAYLGMNAILHQARLYLHRLSGEARAAEVAREHADILRAFEVGDGLAASTALRHHLEGGKRRLIDVDESLAD
jgi:DNA-binding GntR family transcriptional regulator